MSTCPARLLPLLSAAVLIAGEATGEARDQSDATGNRIVYRLFKPAGYDAAKPWPLVLFLHGAGERGSDNAKHLKNGAETFYAAASQAKFPCFVVIPQCPPNRQWVEVPWSGAAHTMPAEPSVPLRLAMDVLGKLKQEFTIDASRQYVVGISMGGFGAWEALYRYPRTFAAAVPVCGGADEAKAASIAQVPVWAFHGDQDNVVKTSRSRNIVAALKVAGGAPKYTEYPGVGHASWTKAFADPEVLPWLFAQRLK